jgi:hypothetical protein
MTATLGFNDRVNETLGIAVELEINSQAADFFNQIMLFLAYGGSCIVKTLDQTSLHMQQMDGVEVQVLPSVGWFPVDLVVSVVSSLCLEHQERQSHFLTLFPW